MHDGIDPRVLASVDETRREFVRKMLMASAFVMPAVASFPLDALAQSGTVLTGNLSLGAISKEPGTETDPARKATPGAVDTIPRAGTPGSPGSTVMTPNIPVTPTAPPPRPPPTPAAPPNPPPRRF